MNKILTLLLLATFVFAQEERDLKYIQDHAELAVQEMELYKIPASITLAQGILETGGGQSRLAEKAFNHFGIKCKREWKGARIYHDDDARGECFRKYNNVEESYRDHSKFLAERPYYKALFKLDINDYKGWSYGLKKAGYATNPRYAPLLISRIEKYDLDAFDKLKSTEVSAYLDKRFKREEPSVIAAIEKPKAVKEIVTKDKPSKDNELTVKENPFPEKNIEVETRERHPKTRIKKHGLGMPFVYMKKGETLESLSETYDVPLSRLKKYNDLADKSEWMYANQPIFLKKKKKKAVAKFYKAKAGETLYSLSQDHGVKYKCLKRNNRLPTNVTFEGGEVISLRGRKK